MKVTLKRSDLLYIWNSLSELSSVRGKAKFTYAVAKNKGQILQKFEEIVYKAGPSPEFQKYLRDKDLLAREYTQKDEYGISKYSSISEQGFKIDKIRKKEYGQKLNKLREKNKKLIDEQRKKMRLVNKLLDEEVTPDFEQIDINDCPKLSSEQRETVELFTSPETAVPKKESKIVGTTSKPRISWTLKKKAFGATRLAMRRG